MKRNPSFAVIGIVFGSIAIFIACIVLTAGIGTKFDTGDKVSYAYYGGDAYSGIQHAAADTAKNVQALSKIAVENYRITCFTLAGTLAVLGFALLCISGNALLEMHARDRFEEAVLKALEKKTSDEPAKSASGDMIVTGSLAAADPQSTYRSPLTEETK